MENLPDRHKSKIAEKLVDDYQTDAFTKRLRKCKENIDRRFKPSLQSLVDTPGLVEVVDLVLEYDQNCCKGVAFVELGSERMRGETLSSFFFIFLEGFFEDVIEVGKWQ